MSKKKRFVTSQKLGLTNGHASEGSAYWDHAERINRRTKEGTVVENRLANPDVLSDDPRNTVWGTNTKPELAELFIERFADTDGQFPILSKMENLVLSYYTSTGDMAYVSKKLKLSRSSINTYLARIRKKFKRLLPLLNY